MCVEDKSLGKDSPFNKYCALKPTFCTEGFRDNCDEDEVCVQNTCRQRCGFFAKVSTTCSSNEVCTEDKSGRYGKDDFHREFCMPRSSVGSSSNVWMAPVFIFLGIAVLAVAFFLYKRSTRRNQKVLAVGNYIQRSPVGYMPQPSPVVPVSSAPLGYTPQPFSYNYPVGPQVGVVPPSPMNAHFTDTNGNAAPPPYAPMNKQ